jgi:hypothetical protein
MEDQMSEEQKTEGVQPDPVVREGVRALASAIQAQMASLEEMNEAILERVEALHNASVTSRVLQTRMLTDHEKMATSVNDLLGSLKRSVDGLSLQVRDLRVDSTKDTPDE